MGRYTIGNNTPGSFPFLLSSFLISSSTPAAEGGYIVYCPELDITTEGESIDQVLEMIKDDASGYIEDHVGKADDEKPDFINGPYTRIPPLP